MSTNESLQANKTGELIGWLKRKIDDAQVGRYTAIATIKVGGYSRRRHLVDLAHHYNGPAVWLVCREESNEGPVWPEVIPIDDITEVSIEERIVSKWERS